LPAIDWGEVGTIAGVGLGMVAAVLVILTAATWLMGAVLRRMEKRSQMGGAKDRAQS